MNQDTGPASRAAYLKARKAGSITLYFKDEAERAHYHELARAAGYARFNDYMLHMLANAASGRVYPPEYVDRIEKEAEKLRGWVAQKDGQIGELSGEVRTLLRQREDLRVLLAATTGNPHDEVLTSQKVTA